MNSFQKLLDFLNRLDEAALTYVVEHSREDTMTVTVSAPSERWEVDFYGNGNVEVEVFYSNSAEEGLEGEEALERLFGDYDDDEYEEEDDEEYEDEDEYEDDDVEYEDEEEFEEDER